MGPAADRPVEEMRSSAAALHAAAALVVDASSFVSIPDADSIALLLFVVSATKALLASGGGGVGAGGGDGAVATSVLSAVAAALLASGGGDGAGGGGRKLGAADPADPGGVASFSSSLPCVCTIARRSESSNHNCVFATRRPITTVYSLHVVQSQPCIRLIYSYFVKLRYTRALYGQTLVMRRLKQLELQRRLANCGGE